MRVNKATKSLFRRSRASTGRCWTFGLDGLTETIKSIGLFRQKAKKRHEAQPASVDDYDGVVPNSRAALQSLPGVGRKTANAC